jgi:hypothetical protein
MREPKRYGQWAGNANGFAENPKRCIEEVYEKIGLRWHQCSKTRGHGPDGLYCHIHNPASVAARRAASDEKYKAERDRIMRPTRERAAFLAALRDIANGHNDPRSLATETLAEWGQHDPRP